MKIAKILLIASLALLPVSAHSAVNDIHSKTLKAAPISADETFIYDTVAGATKKMTLAPFLSGDCTGFPCWDGTSDGGSLMKWYGPGGFWQAIQAGNSTANRSWRLPIATAPAAGATQVMTMDEYGQMAFMGLPDVSGKVLSSTTAGVLSWATAGTGGGYTNLTQFVDQTAWRVFYSNTAGDITELALGADGTYLKSNGATSAPTWATPSGTMAWPAGAGIAVYGGSSAWGTSLTLDTDISSVSASDDSVASAKATKTALDLKANASSISFVAGALSDMKILDTAQPANGSVWVDDTLAYGGTDDQLHLWSIDKIGGLLAGKQATISANTYQDYDADLTSWAGISPTTGSINTSGTVQAKVPFNSYSTAQTLTAATHNSTIVQMTVAAEVTLWDCETANVGDTVMLWARDAEKIEVVPASGDHFALFAGTALTANYELDMAATAGTKVTLMCTADDTWSVYSETAASVDGGAAD